MMTTELITPATVDVLSVTQVRNWLKLDHTDDDTELTHLIKAATSFVEREIRRILMTSTWDIHCDDLPDNRIIRLPINPIQTLLSITCKTSGSTHTLAQGEYEIDTKSAPARLMIKSTWISDQAFSAWTIRVIAGFASPEAVPETLKQAILRLVTHWYEHRGALAFDPKSKGNLDAMSLSAQIPDDVPHLLKPWRILSL